MRTPQYMLIGSLAVSDFGVGIGTAPLTLVTACNNGQWYLGESACTYQAMANATFFMATMLTLMAMTMEKYFSIVRPLSRFVTGNRTKKFIVMAWLFPLIFSCLPTVGIGRFGSSTTTQSCGIAFPKTPPERVYLMLTFVLGIVFPIGVMIIAYIIIFKAICSHSKRLKRHVRGEAAKAGITASQKHFTITVAIILAVFIASWTPFLLLVVAAERTESVEELPPFLGVLAYWFGYAASAWNPVIYVTRNRRFRQGAVQMRDMIFCRNENCCHSNSRDLETARQNSNCDNSKTFSMI